MKFVHDLVIIGYASPQFCVFPPIQQSRYIDVSISEFQKTFENLRLAWCFFYHVMEMLTEATARGT